MLAPSACGHWVDQSTDRCTECEELGGSPDPWDLVDPARPVEELAERREYVQSKTRRVDRDLALRSWNSPLPYKGRRLG